MATGLGIFGLTFFGPALPAVAKEIPTPKPNGTEIAPVPPVGTGLYSLTDLALFFVGAALGCLVVKGIKYLQGK